MMASRATFAGFVDVSADLLPLADALAWAPDAFFDAFNRAAMAPISKRGTTSKTTVFRWFRLEARA
jgi:hypothetical protein